MTGVLCPAVGHDHAVLGIQRNDNAAAVLTADVMQESRSFHGSRSDHDIVHAEVEHFADALQRAHTATDFNFNVFCEFIADLADHGKVHGLSASGRVQVNQMQTFGAELNPMTGLSNGVSVEDSNVGS